MNCKQSMDVEALPLAAKKERKLTGKRRRRYICLCLISFVLGLGLLLLILGLTVFKAKKPTTTVDSVTLSDVEFSIDALRLRVSLNLTLDTDVTVRNPNRVSFKYTNSTCYLRYRGNDVGVVPIPAGRIGARDSRGLNVSLTLMADRLLSNSEFYSDVVSGTLPLQTYIRISGKVRILFNIHVVTYSTCDLVIDLSDRSVANQTCHYKSKL
ncbi:hypothetical protein F511_14216 [Dorcoceras hygrometricum]|uniref:Late embryogenesis abundant protein LEA-2 subgroup domain-containing protein n=1 Tax=Dorcoceras hygrometricum TaxID=472368 RepID=A0A2Z7BRD8_9LAMI|nr:hypothetical protein F511_14216 [Dorcoceras hygrometricum]